MDKPFIYLAFANEGGNFLQYLQRERKLLYNILKSHLHPEHEAEVTINDVFRIFRENRGKLAIFHYSGHAGSGKFNLHGNPLRAESFESLIKQEKEANASSLALVFLNACTTEEHVGYLQDLGVECVIATEDGIDDELAKEFSAQFYIEFVSGKTIANSFESAKSWFFSQHSTEDFFWQLHELKANESGNATLQTIKDQFALRTPIQIFENQAFQHLSCLKLEARTAHELAYCYRQEKPMQEVGEAVKKLTDFAHNKDYLQIIVLSEQTQDWKPFGENTILELLLEFRKEAEIGLHIVFMHDLQDEERKKHTKLKTVIRKKSILMVDANALQNENNQKFAKLFDEDNNIGGLLMPLCAENDLKTLVDDVFAEAYRYWKATFDEPYMFIDLEVREKALLFRRLKDIEHYHIHRELTIPNKTPEA